MKKTFIAIIILLSLVLLINSMLDSILDKEHSRVVLNTAISHKANYLCKVGDVEIVFENVLKEDAMMNMLAMMDGVKELEGQIPVCKEVQ